MTKLTDHDQASKCCFNCAGSCVDDVDDLVCVLKDGKKVSDDDSCEDWN